VYSVIGVVGVMMPWRMYGIGKSLSWLLRHSGLPIRSDGYMPVLEVLSTPTMHRKRVTLEDLEYLVAKNDKQRYQMEEEESPPLMDLLSFDLRNGYSHSQSQL
jgi:RNA:NAD 2'-phosphotransferase (TPT1/KptA family)